MTVDTRSIADKAPQPERHVAVVVVGAGAAGVAAAIEAARAGVEVLLIDENPIDNDMMAMDVPLYFGQRMERSVRNRALMMERVVATNPALAEAHEAGVDVQLGTYVWGAFVNGPTVRELPGPMLGLADDRRSWLVGYDRLIVAAGARDVAMGFPGWERAGAMGANGAAALLTRYRALGSKRMVIVGSGDLGLRTAALALESGVAVAGIVEVADTVRGDEEIARSLAGRGVPFYTAHTIREARGRVGEIESVVLVQIDGDLDPVAGSEREIACDTVCLALGLVPNVELLHLVGARLVFASALGGWVPAIDDCHADERPHRLRRRRLRRRPRRHARRSGDRSRSRAALAGIAAAQSLGAVTPTVALPHRRSGHRRGSSSPHPLAAVAPVPDPGRRLGGQRLPVRRSHATGAGRGQAAALSQVGVRRKWTRADLGTMLRDGPVNQDQIKRLTRAGMGPCQGRRCREQVALLARAGDRHLHRSNPAAELPAAHPPPALERALAQGRAARHARRMGELVRHPDAVQSPLGGRHGHRRTDGADPPHPQRRVSARASWHSSKVARRAYTVPYT